LLSKKMNAFWALEIEPNKVYTQVPPTDLHLTQAALDSKAKTTNRVVLECSVDGGTFTLGSLRLNQVEQFPLDIILDGNQEVSFHVKGEASVHLFGYYMDNQDESDDDDDHFSHMLDESDFSDELEEGEEEDEEGNDLEEGDEIKPLPKSKPVLKIDDSKKRKNEADGQPAQSKKTKSTEQSAETSELLSRPLSKKEKRKLKEQEESQETPKSTPQTPKAVKEVQDTPKSNKKENQNTPKPNKENQNTPKNTPKPTKESKDTPKPTKERQDTPKSAKEPQDTPRPNNKKKAETPSDASDESSGTPLKESAIKKLPNGLVIEDVLLGAGAAIQDGKKVGVKYIGRFPDGKVFDSSSKRPFSFRFGVGSVIKGWDMGLKGMKVGGKRKLIVPSNLGYGAKGAPPGIPPNATLHFEIELVEV